MKQNRKTKFAHLIHFSLLIFATGINPVWGFQGDLNTDGKIDLADAVLGLRIVAGYSENANQGADVNGNNKTGLEEVLFVIQYLAEFRGNPLTLPCADTPGLIWKTAVTTNYESYPDPGSEECLIYNGCEWMGQFAMCDEVKSEAWVKSHNIVAFFPLDNMGLHDICLKSGSKSIRVTVLDTCGDSDCGGCCTANKGNAEALIDLEKFTYQRFGVPDDTIQWADMGPTITGGCN